jgi:hypothetical protein
MQMPMSAWAPAMWRTIHAVALAYRPSSISSSSSGSKRAAYRAFYLGLGDVLPCDACAQGYKRLLAPGGQLLAELDAALDDGLLLEWTVRLHDAVTEHSGKKGGGPGNASAASRQPVEAWTADRLRQELTNPAASTPGAASDASGGIFTLAGRTNVVGLTLMMAAGFFVALVVLLILWFLLKRLVPSFKKRM